MESKSKAGPTGARAPQLKLYYTPGACSLAAHVALEEAGAAFEAICIDLAANQQRSAEYLAINPRGRVPTLVLDGQPIGENIAILTCLARLFPDARLLPADLPLTVARAYELMAWLTSTVQVSVSQVFRGGRFTSDEATQAVLKRDGRGIVATHYQTIEAGLTDDWALGGSCSVLDPLLLVFWRWGGRLDLDMTAYPRWSAHAARVQARPAVARALQREAQA